MKYNEVRDTIKSGDLLAWSHRGVRNFHDLKVAIVRTFTRSEYSHVGVAWVVGGRVMVIEAVQPCVRVFPLSRCGDFYFVPTEAVWTSDAEVEALSHLGDEYSEWDAVKAFFGRKMKGVFSECAALVINILNKAEVNLGERATPDAVVLEAQTLGYPTYFIKQKESK